MIPTSLTPGKLSNARWSHLGGEGFRRGKSEPGDCWGGTAGRVVELVVDRSWIPQQASLRLYDREVDGEMNINEPS